MWLNCKVIKKVANLQFLYQHPPPPLSGFQLLQVTQFLEGPTPLLQACTLFSCFKQGFNYISNKKQFNSCYKEEHLKGKRDCKMFFVHILPFTLTNLMQQNYFKKISEGVWDSNFQWSGQVRFAKFLCLAPTMVLAHGSLYSWNHWINDQPLHLSLSPPLLKDNSKA